jgi:hypothetical protein
MAKIAEGGCAMDISMKDFALALVGALTIATSASAQQASPEPTTSPATPVATSATPNAETAPATTATSTKSQSQPLDNPRPSPGMIKDASQFGYKMSISAKTGTYIFCKTDSQIGTRFQSTKCMNPDMLAQILEQQKRDQNYARAQLGQLTCGSSKMSSGC